jgi:hypothetical protein
MKRGISIFLHFSFFASYLYKAVCCGVWFTGAHFLFHLTLIGQGGSLCRFVSLQRQFLSYLCIFSSGTICFRGE